MCVWPRQCSRFAGLYYFALPYCRKAHSPLPRTSYERVVADALRQPKYSEPPAQRSRPDRVKIQSCTSQHALEIHNSPTEWSANHVHSAPAAHEIPASNIVFCLTGSHLVSREENWYLLANGLHGTLFKCMAGPAALCACSAHRKKPFTVIEEHPPKGMHTLCESKQDQYTRSPNYLMSTVLTFVSCWSSFSSTCISQSRSTVL